MTFLFLAIVAAAVIPAVLTGKDLLSPGRLYLAVYSLLLAVCSLNLSRLQTPWTLTSLLLFYGASFLFLAGQFMILMLDKSKFPEWNFDSGNIRATLEEDAKNADWDWFFKVWLAFSLTYLAAFLAATVLSGGLPMLAAQPDKARLFFLQVNHLATYGLFCGPLSLMFAIEILLFGRLEKRRRRVVIFLGGFVFLLYMTLVTRYDVFRVVLFGLVLYHYGKRRLGFLHLGGGLVALLGVFMIGFFIRVKSDSIQAFNEMIQIKLPKKIAWASNIYAYLANDFWNFDFVVRKFVDGTHYYPLQYGFGMFRGFLNPLYLEGPLAQAYGFDSIFNEHGEMVKGLNTIIYIWPLYKDFGTIGVYAVTFVASIALGIFYRNTMRKPTLMGITLWALFFPALALSYHAALWELWFFYFDIAAFMVIHRRLGLFGNGARA